MPFQRSAPVFCPDSKCIAFIALGYIRRNLTAGKETERRQKNVNKRYGRNYCSASEE